MSQIIKNLLSGPVPPSVATSYETQDGTAVPLANVLIIHAIDSTENNINGIISKGGVAGTGTQNEVDIVLTNRATGAVSTTDATPTTIITFSLGASPGVYTFVGTISGFNSTVASGGSYQFVAGARTTGVAGTLIASQISDIFEEAGMSASDISVSVSGNDFLVTVTGIAATNISWFSQFNFTLAG